MAMVDHAEPDAALLLLAEELRQVVGGFVRTVTRATGTPSDAGLDTLGLLDREGPMTVAALAQRRRVRHQSMRLVVAQLEADGMVARSPDPFDARGRQVELTATGRSTLDASRAARADWIAAGLERHTTARERQALSTAIEVLRRLADAPD